MSLLRPNLLFEVILEIPPPGRAPTRYTTRFPDRLTPEERAYVAGHLLGQILEVCQELGVRLEAKVR